jgi:hypothetical protein
MPDLSKVDFDARRRVHLERHHVRRARAERRLDPADRDGPDDLRRHLGRVRAGARRSPSSTSSPSPGRRRSAARRARHGDPVAPRGRSGSRPTPPPGRCRRSSASTKGGKITEGDLRGRDDQHAVDAVRRGLSRCAALGEVDRRARGPVSHARRRNLAVLAAWVAKTPWVDFLAGNPADALEHLGLPEDHRSRWFDGARRQGAQADRRQGWPHWLEKEGVAYDIAYRERPAGPADLGRRHRRGERSRSPVAVARLGLCRRRPAEGRRPEALCFIQRLGGEPASLVSLSPVGGGRIAQAIRVRAPSRT